MYGHEEETRMATMADAHAEWHWNAGVPMGQPGCPQDACHPVDDDADHELPADACIELGDDCNGPVEYRMALSGTGRSYPRCAHHWDRRLDKEQELQERYPPQPPDDWSHWDAGEYWDEGDY